MKTLFITAGGLNWASSRMRAYWVAPYMGADVMTSAEYDQGQTSSHDAYIFQKFFNQEAAADLRAMGKRVFWDICDPVWWWQPADVCGLLANCDGVVCSTDALADDLGEWIREQGMNECPVHVIPDRIEPSHFPVQHDYTKESQVVRFIWYGMAANRIGIYAAVDNLHRLRANGFNISLTIFDDRPDIQLDLGNIPVYHIKWDLEKENRVIAEHDIALLPPYPGAWGKVKSNNRVLTAWACGIPATDGDGYYGLWNTIYSLRVRGNGGLLKPAHHVKESANQWQQILWQQILDRS